MRKEEKGAEALKEKLDRLTEPEKRLVLAYIKEIEAGAVLKDRKPKRATRGTCDYVSEYTIRKAEPETSAPSDNRAIAAGGR